MVSAVRGGAHVNVFVAAGGNAFMADIASWLVEAAIGCGRTAALHRDGSIPLDRAAINLVVAPHEFYLLNDATDADIHAAAAISVPVCTEQPGTPWFEMTSLLCTNSPMVFDINRHGVDALLAEGFDAHHLQIGAVPSMDRRGEASATGEQVTRDIDVLFLGGLTDHRAESLATLASSLWNHNADLRLFTFDEPVHGDVSGLVFGADKYDLLARSKIMVNIHRDAPSGAAGYFEWARMVEAMANGCAIVSEPSGGAAPLRAGDHFIESTNIAAAVAELLDDPERCAALGAQAAAAVLGEYPLTDSLGPALDLVERREHVASIAGRMPSYRSTMQRAQQIPLLPAFRPFTDIRRRVYDAMHAESQLQRHIDAMECRIVHGDAEHHVVIDTAAYTQATPEVSIVVTLYNYADVVAETLDSIVASRDVDFEVVVVDDHSLDDGRQVVADFMTNHPDVPMRLIGVDANRGLAASRNRAIEHARGDKVMIMDADNLVYPTALRRLADALDHDPGATFSWSILEEFGVTTGLRSAVGWYLPWLCAANNIDAQAMVRRAAFEQHGGYRADDPDVFGWEDWEFWLRLAASGERGVHVRQMLGRYRTQGNSMLATVNLLADLMVQRVRDLYPDLPWPKDM